MSVPQVKELVSPLPEISASIDRKSMSAPNTISPGVDTPSDDSLNIKIAREVCSVADRMRRLCANGFLGRVLDRSIPTPILRDDLSPSLIELSDMCQAQNGGIDGFTLQVPQHATSKKESLTIRGWLTNAETGAKEAVGSLDILITGERYGDVPPRVGILSTEDGEEWQRRINHAYRIFMAYGKTRPWLRAFHVLPPKETRDIAVQMKSADNQEVSQFLIRCAEEDPDELIAKMNAEITAERKWDLSSEGSKHMALGVLLGAKKELKIR